MPRTHIKLSRAAQIPVIPVLLWEDGSKDRRILRSTGTSALVFTGKDGQQM